jgi:hypothetical protein
MMLAGLRRWRTRERERVRARENRAPSCPPLITIGAVEMGFFSSLLALSLLL